MPLPYYEDTLPDDRRRIPLLPQTQDREQYITTLTITGQGDMGELQPTVVPTLPGLQPFRPQHLTICGSTPGAVARMSGPRAATIFCDAFTQCTSQCGVVDRQHNSLPSNVCLLPGP